MITSIQGMHAWLLQRMTAVFMLVYFVASIVYFVFSSPDHYSQWREAMTSMPIAIATVLFFVALSLHAWVGLRDVVIDYIHRFSLRILLLGLIFVLLFGQTLWVILVLAKAMP
jgi:succinate dehydrogenase / fumarate reductase membrane anchor subunit